MSLDEYHCTTMIAKSRDPSPEAPLMEVYEVKPEAGEAAGPTGKEKRGRGRPKGSKNKPKESARKDVAPEVPARSVQHVEPAADAGAAAPEDVKYVIAAKDALIFGGMTLVLGVAIGWLLFSGGGSSSKADDLPPLVRAE